ncbi:MAG TPA: gamma carbonic anhydrase family protein [Clostridiales bacterium]|nr:gamma carbonic anhydrase family protein [Clostridiales bacterium]
MIMTYKDNSPTIDESCFIADTATVAGNVEIGKDSSVWFGATVRGDIASIKIGECSNIQENSVIHVDLGKPVSIGNNVTVGHGAIIHGCTIGNNCLIGMGAIIMNGATIGDNSIIGAGALVTENTQIPENSVAFGSPAKVTKEVSDKTKMMIKLSSISYKNEAQEYKKG